MAIHSSGLSLNMAALSARLLEEREAVPRARITAQSHSGALCPEARSMYIPSHPLPEGDAWTVMVTAGEAAAPESLFRCKPERWEFWRTTRSLCCLRAEA